MGKITLKNISTATVVISVDGFHKELTPGRVVNLTKNSNEELMNDPGFNNLLIGHYVKINGVEDEEAVIASSDIGTIYELDNIKKMFADKDYSGFKDFLANATMAEKDTVERYAIDNGITDPGFTAPIKKHCGIDVISAINIKHQSEEK